MTKFMYLFRGGDAKMAEASAEERQSHMEKWRAWMGQLQADGKLADGFPLSGSGRQVRKGGELILDAPFTEGTEMVGGYLIVNAETIDEAVELSKACPIFEHKGQVEVREILSM